MVAILWCIWMYLGGCFVVMGVSGEVTSAWPLPAGAAMLAVGLSPVLFAPFLWMLEKREEKREKRERWKGTFPGLFDTAKSLSKQGVELFNRKEYERALKAFEESLSKFNEAGEGAKYDAELAKSIEANLSATRKNIIACDMGIGSSKSGDARRQFDAGSFEGALDTYKGAMSYFEAALNGAREIKDNENANVAKDLMDKTNSNIENCYIAIDKSKVEDLSERANSLFSEASGVKEKRELYKARDKLKEVESMIDEAFTLAAKRDFTEAKVALSNLLKEVRDEMNEVYELIASGVEEVGIKPKLEEVKPGAAPSIPLLRKEKKKAPPYFPSELLTLYYDASLIGSGGFARVFRAKRRTDGTAVAVKVPLNLDAATGRSFVREISSWQQLKHTNIVKLYDLNILPIPYLEMELCQRSLNELPKPLEVEKAASMAFHIAEGLKHAHSHGTIHRDLKPQNILLQGEVPKIADWGLSKVVSETTSTTRAGLSPRYAAPEQLEPQRLGKPDHRTDIYQLGAIFYELVTGEPPFKGDSLTELFVQIITAQPEKTSDLNTATKPVEPIVMKCLRKEMKDRYQSVAEMQRDLAEYLKVEFKNALSKSRGDMTRSGYYCAELCLVYLRVGDVVQALKYAADLKHYASEGLRAELAGLISELEHRQKESIGISEDLLERVAIVLHQARMGR